MELSRRTFLKTSGAVGVAAACAGSAEAGGGAERGVPRLVIVEIHGGLDLLGSSRSFGGSGLDGWLAAREAVVMGGLCPISGVRQRGAERASLRRVIDVMCARHVVRVRDAGWSSAHGVHLSAADVRRQVGGSRRAQLMSEPERVLGSVAGAIAGDACAAAVHAVIGGWDDASEGDDAAALERRQAELCDAIARFRRIRGESWRSTVAVFVSDLGRLGTGGERSDGSPGDGCALLVGGLIHRCAWGTIGALESSATTEAALALAARCAAESMGRSIS